MLPGERPIQTANNNLLTLTSHRLWYEVDSGGDKELRTVMLEDLCYCDLVHSEKPLWLLLAILAFIMGLVMWGYNRSFNALIAGAVLGVIFWWLYQASKKQTMDLASAGGKITIQLRSADLAMGREFISSVLMAKNNRILTLFNNREQAATASSSG